MLAGLKRAAYHIIHDAFVATTNADVDGLDDRHRSIYDRMQAQDQRASRNELAPKSARWLKASAGVKQLLYHNVSSPSVNGRLLVRIGKALLPILRREISPTKLMLSEQLLYTYYEKALRVDRVLSQIAQLLQISAHHNPRATVLEIGAGTGACTGAILNALGGGDSGAPLTFSHYTFTDISPEFLDQFARGLPRGAIL